VFTLHQPERVESALIETLKVSTDGELNDGVPAAPATGVINRRLKAYGARAWPTSLLSGCISVREALWSRSSQTAAFSPQCLPRASHRLVSKNKSHNL